MSRKLDDLKYSNAVDQAYRGGFARGATAGYCEASKFTTEMIGRIHDLIEDEEVKELLKEAIFKIQTSNYIGEKR